MGVDDTNRPKESWYQLSYDNHGSGDRLQELEILGIVLPNWCVRRVALQIRVFLVTWFIGLLGVLGSAVLYTQVIKRFCEAVLWI